MGIRMLRAEKKAEFAKEMRLRLNAPREQPEGMAYVPASVKFAQVVKDYDHGQAKISLQKLRAELQQKRAEIQMKRAEMAEMERQGVLCAAADALLVPE